MPQSNVKKLVKKEVKREERKKHGGGKRKPKKQRKYTNDRVANARIKGAGAKAVATISKLASGATLERRIAAELAKRLCVPNMYSSFAVQDGFQTMPVGVASPYMVIPATFSSANDTSYDALGIPHSETWAFAFRDVNRCLVYYDANERTCKYYFVDDRGNNQFTKIANAQVFDFDTANYDSGVPVHGYKLFSGVVSGGGRGSGSRWYVGNKLEFIEITGLAASTAVTLTVQYMIDDEVWTGTIPATSTAGGVATFLWSNFVKQNVTDPDLSNFFHWRIQSCSLAITNGLVGFGKDNVLCGFRQLCLADFDQLGDFIERLRMSSLNLMLSNTAQVINKGGMIAGRQLPSNIDPFLLALNGYEEFANKPDTLRIDAFNGAHMFYKTSNIKDWEFKTVGDPDGQISSGGGNYIIDAESDYLAMSVTMPVANERGGYWSVFTNVEFRHNNVWLPRVTPGHTKRVFEDALEILAGVPQLHENPFHVKDIFKWIGQHKGQIQQTLDLGASAFGGARAKGYTDVANNLLDVWFGGRN